jgi:hypothetical protein
MIQASTSFALCEHVERRGYRVVRKGSARLMRRVLRAIRRDCPDKKHCVFLSISSQIGDLIR